MSVTVSDILIAARSSLAAVSSETAGYLVLGTADCLGDGASELGSVYLDEAGALRVDRGAPSGALDAETGLRTLLKRLLETGRSPAPALLRVATTQEKRGVPRLITEIEAALIPVNRSAARRALARLHRDVSKARATSRAFDGQRDLVDVLAVSVQPPAVAPSGRAPSVSAPAAVAAPRATKTEAVRAPAPVISTEGPTPVVPIVEEPVVHPAVAPVSVDLDELIEPFRPVAPESEPMVLLAPPEATPFLGSFATGVATESHPAELEPDQDIDLAVVVSDEDELQLLGDDTPEPDTERAPPVVDVTTETPSAFQESTASRYAVAETSDTGADTFDFDDAQPSAAPAEAALYVSIPVVAIRHGEAIDATSEVDDFDDEFPRSEMALVDSPDAEDDVEDAFVAKEAPVEATEGSERAASLQEQQKAEPAVTPLASMDASSQAPALGGADAQAGSSAERDGLELALFEVDGADSRVTPAVEANREEDLTASATPDDAAQAVYGVQRLVVSMFELSPDTSEPPPEVSVRLPDVVPVAVAEPPDVAELRDVAELPGVAPQLDVASQSEGVEDSGPFDGLPPFFFGERTTARGSDSIAEELGIDVPLTPGAVDVVVAPAPSEPPETVVDEPSFGHLAEALIDEALAVEPRPTMPSPRMTEVFLRAAAPLHTETVPGLGFANVAVTDSARVEIERAAAASEAECATEDDCSAPMTAEPVESATEDDGSAPMMAKPVESATEDDGSAASLDDAWDDDPFLDLQSPTPSEVAPAAPSIASTYRPRRSDVAELVAAFVVAETRTLAELTRELKRIAGIGATPAPPSTTVARSRKASSDR